MTETTKEFIPIGMHKDTGDFTGPIVPNVGRLEGKMARKWFESQSYTWVITGPDGEGSIRLIVPARDSHGGRGSYFEAPRGAPIFDYHTANEIKKIMDSDKDSRPVDALCAVLDLRDVSVNWLKDAGAKSDDVPDPEEIRKDEKEKLMGFFQDEGVEIPESVRDKFVNDDTTEIPEMNKIEEPEIEDDPWEELNLNL